MPRPLQFRLRSIFLLITTVGCGCAAWRSWPFTRDWIQQHGDRLIHFAVEMAILLVFTIFILCLVNFFPQK